MNFVKIVMALTTLTCGLTDILRRFSVGPITSLGLLTILLGVGSWLLVFTRSKIPKTIFVASGLVLFILLAFLSWLWHFKLLSPVTVIQNLSVFLAFVGFLLLSTIASYRTADPPLYMSDALTRATQLSVGFYGLSILIGGPGTSVIMGARAFALFAIVGLAWFLAAWRYRLPRGLWWAGCTTVVLALSFSRTALIIAVILFPLSQISLTSIKGWVRMVLSIALIAIVSYLAFTYVEPIRSRFTDVGDNAKIGGVQVNTSGRDQIWVAVYDSAVKSLWIGQGPTSVSPTVLAVNTTTGGHPHNDYLRIFHDYGLMGLGFWLLGYWGLIIKTWQNWQWADRKDRANAHIHLGAFLALVAVAIAMITDNVVVYIFSMAPLGILAGASLGSASRRKKVIKSARKLALFSDNFGQLPTPLHPYSTKT